VLNGSAPKLSVPLTTWELTRDIDAIIALAMAVERAEDKPEPVTAARIALATLESANRLNLGLGALLEEVAGTSRGGLRTCRSNHSRIMVVRGDDLAVTARGLRHRRRRSRTRHSRRGSHRCNHQRRDRQSGVPHQRLPFLPPPSKRRESGHPDPRRKPVRCQARIQWLGLKHQLGMDAAGTAIRGQGRRCKIFGSRTAG
jgi:hypothetical protein